MGCGSTFSLSILVPLIGTNGKRKNSLSIFLQAVRTISTKQEK
jgi:hypothetical protein